MIHKFEELTSTNKYAMENINKFLSYDVIVCENQTAGYGVTGMWENKVGNLFYTIVLDEFIVDLKRLPFMILNSMHQVVNQVMENAYIKLPNDLYYEDKKIGGFIIEQKNDKYIIGIGINVNANVESHIAIKDVVGYDIDLDKFIDTLTRNIMLQVIKTDSEVLTYFNNHVKIVGETINYQDKKTKIEYEDTCVSIDFDKIYFKNNTIDIKKFSICGNNV